MQLKPYPWTEPKTLIDVINLLREICNYRKLDALEAANLDNIFISGRKTGKIPTSSADVSPKDRIGDISITDTALYVLVDNAGTPEWRMAALTAF